MDSRCESLYLDSLIDLPDEVLLIILSFLPVPDLLQCSRACHLLYFLAADPILHRDRLANAAVSLRKELSRRKTRAAISPPNAWIWLSKTNVLSRSISRSLIKIRLSHNLTTRPAIRDLVTRSVLPAYALNVSPILIQSQRAVYKHHLRDGLAAGPDLGGHGVPLPSLRTHRRLGPGTDTLSQTPLVLNHSRRVSFRHDLAVLDERSCTVQTP